jgi:hypothetical protein
MTKLTLTEQRLAALALDAACVDNELEAASLKFFEALRKRGVRAEALAPDWLVVCSLHSPTNIFELKALSKRLGRCVRCGARTTL